MTGCERDRIAGIVLAAGASTRMGRPKQLIEHRGKPLVLRAAEAVVETGACPVAVVLGAQADLIQPVLAGVSGIKVVINRAWQRGIASSLGAGLRAIADESWDGVLVTLADQPLVNAESLRRLLAGFRGGARLVASSYDGAPGVPAIFAAEHVPDLLRLSGDAGAAKWLRGRAGDVMMVPLDGALTDIDTAADLALLTARQNAG